jgi:DNA-binding NarL/FixJ family response regulator
MKFPSTGRGHTSVLIVDSNKTQSEILDSALRRQPGLKIARCRSEVSECLAVLRSTPIDVLLLGDSATGHESLIDVLRVLHTSHPQVRFVLMIDGFDRSFVVNALRTGARGLFDRAHLPFRALCRCISVVHQGQIWVNTEQLGYLVEEIASPTRVRIVDARGERLLTVREEQVVGMVADGAGNRAIAQQLGIKENTVKKSLMRIYDKLGLCNRVELVLYALTHRGPEKQPEPTPSMPGTDTFGIDGAESETSILAGAKANWVGDF